MKQFIDGYPILYSRASTGAIQQWQIVVEKDYFFTIAGQKDGALTKSKPNYCTAKNVGRANETCPHDQAELEAFAKYLKKLKAGYHSDIRDIDKVLFIEPMLAKNFKDRLDKIVYPVIVDRKYNGGRLITHKAGLFTRKGEKYVSIPHLFENELFEKFPNLVLDGEAYNHDYRYKLNEIMSLIRRTVNVTASDLEISRAMIKYYIYDGYGFDDVTADTSQFERRAKLYQFVSHWMDERFVPVHGDVADNEKEVWKFYQSYVDDGYEGAIVRLNGPYEHKRSSNLLKVKPEDDDEGIITDVLEGSGNWSGAGKTVTLKWKDKIFDASVKGTYEQAAQLLKDKKKWIGREVTFLYNGLTGLGIPNYARIDMDNCFKK